MALTSGRKDLDNAGLLVQTLGRPADTGKTFYNGAMVALFGGYLRPVTGAFGEKVVGICDLTLADNVVTSGSAGATKIQTKAGIFPFLIGGSSDALVQADVGSRVYAIDDTTVGKTDGGARRPIAGQLVFVEALGSVTRAYVAIGFETPDASASQVSGFGQAPDTISAAGALSLLDTTLWSLSGTQVLTLADGTVLGQRKRVVLVASTSTPVGSIVVATPRGFATITAISGIGSFFELVWTATGWILGPSRGGTIA